MKKSTDELLGERRGIGVNGKKQTERQTDNRLGNGEADKQMTDVGS